jgi:hypothetical protein
MRDNIGPALIMTVHILKKRQYTFPSQRVTSAQLSMPVLVHMIVALT